MSQIDPEEGDVQSSWKARRASIAAPVKKQKLGNAYSVGKKKTGLGNQLDTMSRSVSQYNLVVCTLAVLGLILQIVIVEATLEGDESPDLVNILKVVVSCTSVGAVVAEAVATTKRFEIAKVTNDLLPGDTAWSSGYITSFALSAVCLLIHSPPGVSFQIPSQSLSVDDPRRGWHRIEYSSEEVICALMFLRLVWCWRIAFNSSGLSTESSRAMSMLYEEPVTRQFFLRYLVKIHPLETMAIFTLSNCFIFAYLEMLFERKADPTFNSFFSAFWMVVITFSTVGYGDVIPHSVFGRLLTIIVCMFALFTIALLISAILMKFQLTPKQHKVVHLLRHSHLQNSLKDKAARVIAVTWRKYVEYSPTGRDVARSRELSHELRQFRTLRKELSVPIDQGSQLLFKELLAMRDHSELMFTLMDVKMTAMEKNVASVDERLDVKLKEITESLKNNLKVMRQLQ